MKKHLFLLLAALMLTMPGMTLSSCGDDNDEPSGGDIVGTWEGSDSFGSFDIITSVFYESVKTYTRFNADNTYISVSDIVWSDEWSDIYEDKHEIEIDRGTYKISGNKLTTKSDDEESISFPCTFNIKGNKMEVQALGTTFTFTRVSDSLIDQYLNSL